MLKKASVEHLRHLHLAQLSVKVEEVLPFRRVYLTSLNLLQTQKTVVKLAGSAQLQMIEVLTQRPACSTNRGLPAGQSIVMVVEAPNFDPFGPASSNRFARLTIVQALVRRVHQFRQGYPANSGLPAKRMEWKVYQSLPSNPFPVWELEDLRFVLRPLQDYEANSDPPLWELVAPQKWKTNQNCWPNPYHSVGYPNPTQQFPPVPQRPSPANLRVHPCRQEVMIDLAGYPSKKKIQFDGVPPLTRAWMHSG